MARAGWIMTGLLALFILGASVAPKLIGASVATDALAAIGWSDRHLLLIGLIELAGIVLFLIPRTALVGALLLGGAIASNLRADMPLFSHTLFGVYLGLMVWGGLWLRDERVRRVMPFLV